MKIKLVFITPNLSAGGAEKVMSFLAQNINLTKFDVKLLVLGFENDTVFNTAGVETIYLNHAHVHEAFISLIKIFRAEKPQIVIGSITHLNVTIGLISYLFPKIVFIGRQAGINKIESNHSLDKANYVYNFLMNIGLKRLNYVICQSVDMLQDCMDEFGIKEEKLKIIRNPITHNFKVKNANDVNNTSIHRFITVGRLDPIKGHERILEVLSKFELPFTYTIIGDGPKKNAILEKVDCLGLKDKVTFITFTSEVSKYLSQSDFFLQGSFSEGFPNALLESCAVGTPVIAFNAPGGTREIIENGINGFIVKDQEEFLEHLNNLEFFDPQKVSESVYKKFAKEIILNEYETFFQKIVDKQNNVY